MVQSRLFRIVKTVLILINLNFVIFSFVLIVFGIGEKVGSSHHESESYSPFINSNTTSLPSPSNILITLGTITIALGLFGLRSVDNYCLILSYAVFISLLALMDMGIGISASFMEASAEKALYEGLSHSLRNYNGSSESQRLMWDRLQTDLKCCGVNGVNDWAGISLDNPKDYQLHFKHYSLVGIPTSCLSQGEDALIDQGNLDNQDFVNENVFMDGCLVKSLTSLGIDRVQRVGFILAAAKTFGAFAASFIAHNIKNSFKAFV